MGRIIHFETGYQTVSAAQDLLELLLATGQCAVVHSVKVHQYSDALASEAELLPIKVKRATGSYTSGSGGGSATVVKNQSTSSAHGLTGIERNNTTQASAGSGTLEVIPSLSGVFNVLAGEYEVTSTPELRLPLAPSEALIVSMDVAPQDALTLNCSVTLEIVAG